MTAQIVQVAADHYTVGAWVVRHIPETRQWRLTCPADPYRSRHGEMFDFLDEAQAAAVQAAAVMS